MALLPSPRLIPSRWLTPPPAFSLLFAPLAFPSSAPSCTQSFIHTSLARSLARSSFSSQLLPHLNHDHRYPLSLSDACRRRWRGEVLQWLSRQLEAGGRACWPRKHRGSRSFSLLCFSPFYPSLPLNLSPLRTHLSTPTPPPLLPLLRPLPRPPTALGSSKGPPRLHKPPSQAPHHAPCPPYHRSPQTRPSPQEQQYG